MNKYMKLYEQITDELKRRIESQELRPGDRVPSIRELRDQYGVSHITVIRSYKELAARNYICQNHGKNYSVCGPKPEEPRRITGNIGFFIRPLSPFSVQDNYFNDITLGIQGECAVRRVNLLCSHTTAPLNHLPINTSAFRAIAGAMRELAGEVDGFLVDEHIPDGVLAPLVGELTKPMVIVNRRSTLAVNTVTPAIEKNFATALDFALRMGYDAFLYMRDVVRTSNFNDFRTAFEAFMALHRIGEERQRVVGNCNLDPHEVSCMAALGYFNELKEKYNKILVVTESDAFARVLVDTLAGRNVGLKQRIGVLAAEGLGYCRWKEPFITSLCSRPIEMGRLATEVLFSCMDGNYKAPANHMPSEEFFLGNTL